MFNPYTIDDFNISKEELSEDISDKILDYHMIPAWELAIDLNAYPSMDSSYRSIQWELDHGRNGNSQHTFKGKGATDWTCDKFKDNKDELLKRLISDTEYTRFAVYNTFIHCDYKPTNNNKRQLFDSDPNSKWTFKKFV